jgi:hypothetical protein
MGSWWLVAVTALASVAVAMTPPRDARRRQDEERRQRLVRIRIGSEHHPLEFGRRLI